MPTSSRHNTIDIRKRGDEGIAPYRFRIGSRNNVTTCKSNPLGRKANPGGKTMQFSRKLPLR